MKIVLDTNIVFATQGRVLKGVDSDLLAMALGKTAITIVVPAVVKQELVKLYREVVREKSAAFQSAARKLASLVPEESLQATCSLGENELVAIYENTLEERFTELRVECPDFSDVPCKALVERCLGGRKPFKRSDEGFRDAIIWETLLRKVAGAGHTTVFVSSNWKDFAAPEDPKTLHRDLLEDLTARNLPPGSVVLCSSLSECLERYVLPSLLLLDKVGMAAAFAVPDWLHSFMLESYEAIVQRAEDQANLDDKAISSLLGVPVTGVRVTELDPNAWETGTPEARPLGPSRVLVELPSTHFCNIEFLVDRRSARRLGRKRLLAVDDDSWAESTVHAHATVEAAFSVKMILNQDQMSVDEWDVTPLQLKGVWSLDELAGEG